MAYRIVLSGLFILSGFACGGTTPPNLEKYYLDLVNQLRSTPSYHMVVEYDAQSSATSEATAGQFEVDFIQPDRSRVIRKLRGREISRDVSIGDRLYHSDDHGSSWSEVEMPPGRLPHQGILARLLESPCEVRGDAAHLVVILRSRTRQCDPGLELAVNVSKDKVSSVVLSSTIESVPISIKAVFDYARPVSEIVAPIT
ncbi:MAG: hypothetical protein ACRDQ2_03860 [Gaiellales bacterium]